MSKLSHKEVVKGHLQVADTSFRYRQAASGHPLQFLGATFWSIVSPSPFPPAAFDADIGELETYGLLHVVVDLHSRIYFPQSRRGMGYEEGQQVSAHALLKWLWLIGRMKACSSEGKRGRAARKGHDYSFLVLELLCCWHVGGIWDGVRVGVDLWDRMSPVCYSCPHFRALPLTSVRRWMKEEGSQKSFCPWGSLLISFCAKDFFPF